MTRITGRVGGTGMLLCLLTLTCPAWPQAADSDPVARVNGEPITRGMLTERLQSEFGKQLLEDMIDELIVLQEARRLKVEVTDKEIDERVDEQKASLLFGQKFETWLAERRMTLASYRARIRILVMLEKIVAPEIKITDEAAASLYLRSPELFGDPEQIRVRAIRCQLRSRAEEILAAVRQAPDQFDRYAKSYSEDSKSREQGGDLGWRPLAANRSIGLTSEKGRISDIVVENDGYWVYQTTDYKPAVKRPWKEVEQAVRKYAFDEQVAVAAVRKFGELKRKANPERLLFPAEGGKQGS